MKNDVILLLFRPTFKVYYDSETRNQKAKYKIQ